jgi:tRNA threonylcarbamoyladenosine biosynthesis protein TsaB
VPGPLTLVFETSSPTASLLLAGPDGVQVERAFTSDRSHNAVLFGPLSEVLAGISPQEIGLVLVGSGPGSYSGTRVGLAAAQGVALAAGCPVVAVPSVIAAPSALAGSCLVIGDARRGSYWTAAVKAGQLEREPELTDEEGFRKLVESAELLISFEDAARTKFPTDRAISFEQPTAALLWQAWRATPPAVQEAWANEPPQPHYLRPPHITESKRTWPVTK